jgi:L-seryl-tRNA(Ser) seleniumtransferase
MEERESPRPPALERLLERPGIVSYFPLLSRSLVVRAVKAELDFARARALASGPGGAAEPRSGGLLDEGTLVRSIASRLEALARRRIRPLLNGTGVLLHPSLGRSPLGADEWEAAADVNTGYSNLELDLESGERGLRGGLAAELAALLVGTESAIVLNNDAAALLLALRALASGREVVLSRGDQLQAEGGFRVPDIIALSGVRVVEVGTANVTTVRDYVEAVGPQTACVLSVRSSDFSLRGLATRPTTAELAAALPRGLPLVVDQGSGCFAEGVPGEVSVSRIAKEGASLVCFSGDKLLGGPQAGIAAGRADLVASLARDGLARALRPGKTILSLLEERLVRVLNRVGEAGFLPDPEELERFGQAVKRRLPRGSMRLLRSSCAIWGSADENFPSYALEPDSELEAAAGGAERVAARLRSGQPPLVAQISDGHLRVELSALRGAEPSLVAGLLRSALLLPEKRQDNAGLESHPD